MFVIKEVQPLSTCRYLTSCHLNHTYSTPSPKMGHLVPLFTSHKTYIRHEGKTTT
ncbi:hypothetical protein Hanom_Chr08g00735741 [Helianthus anomalus]